ncbi:MAG: integrase, partial [Proteobacteria bacterium]|nr:integrase [Pseudomonadota bacterium]
YPVTKVDAKGKQRKTYPYEAMMTPFEKFMSLTRRSQYLKPRVTLKQLNAIAFAITDNEAAKRLKKAKHQLFKTISEQENQAA